MASDYPYLNFGDLFEAVAATFPERTAVIYGGDRLSWQDLDRRANRLARALSVMGLEPGSKVAFYLRNSPAYVELFAACAKGRFVHANVNYRYVAEELHYLLDNADAEVVAYDAEFRGEIDKLRDRLPTVKAYLEVGGSPHEGPAFALPFEVCCREGSAEPLGNERSGEDLYFMYTGGTTGYPKAVMWPAAARIAAIGMTPAPDVASHIELLKQADHAPVALPAAPLMHSTGLTTMLSTLVNGGTLVLLPTRSFDAAACLAQLEAHRVERLALVGDAFSLPLLEALEAEPGRYDLDSVKLISSAGAMWSERLKQGLLRHFTAAQLSDSLGSSEGSRIGISTTRPGESGATGRFRPGEGVKLFREDFTEVAAGSGEAGRLAKAGPLPLGYYKDEAGTASTFPVVDGVRYSMAGDWCRLEADGTMTLLGRGNNCINTGGEKVYPEEVEEALKQVPGVKDAAVLGMPDERWGERVTAIVRGSTPAPSTEAIQDHLSQNLARYKHPRVLLLTDVEFRHENGKINYREARRIMAAHLENSAHSGE
ncbi:MAG: AMP-binding protein [Pseudomonadota bacterium]